MGACVAKVREDIYVRRFAPEHDHPSFHVSRRIERQLRTQEQEDKNMIKLLLLGSGNSGKSTVMKQFKIIHKRGFTTEERRVFRDALWKSAIEAMRSLVRSRQEYISAMRLLDDDIELNEEGQRERALIDPAMEPYFQFLLFRVRDDQPLYEEVIIPVAAEPPNPKAECFSPLKDKKEPTPDAAPAVPLMTATTILLSSPPVTERKSPLDGEEMLNENGEPLVLPESAVTAKRDPNLEDAESVGIGSKMSDVSELLPSSREGESTIGGLSPIADVTPEMPSFVGDDGELLLDGTNYNESRMMLNDETVTSNGHQQQLDAPYVNGKNGVLDTSNISTSNKRARSPLSPDVVVDEDQDLNSPTNGGLDEGNGNGVMADDEDMPKKRSSKEERRRSKKAFATPEDEAAYLLAKQERRRRKKKKREKNKRKMQDDTNVSFSGLSGGGGKKKIFSGSSVESFRSDLSKNNNAAKAAAPTVTWEKITVGRLLQKIWMDPLIQRMYAVEEKSPQLEAPMGYIMNAMDRISEQGFTPTNEDILFARKRTSGVNLLEFEAYGAKFLLIDVGGQRNERKKWLAHFDIVDAVIFVVGLDQYDQVMMEDGVTNRLKDSLDLFEEMCSSPWFRNSSFLLFLNKSDVFKTKIKQIPLTVCFRGYQGDPYDYDQTSKYIIRRFQQIHSQHASAYRDAHPQGHRRRGGHQAIPHVYPYMTNATDTESMRFVIDTCQDILLRSEMAQWGFFDF